MKKQLLSAAMVGLLGLSLTGCGTSKNEATNTSTSNQKEVASTKESTTSSSKKEEQVSKEFLNKIEFADYVGSEKDSQLDPATLEKFDKKGYTFSVNEEGDEATVYVPCYDENGNIYSNIITVEHLRNYGEGLEPDSMGTTIMLSGLPKTISENISEFDGCKYDEDETVGSEDNGSLFIITERTKTNLVDSEGHEFHINYDEKALMAAKQQLDASISEKEE